VDKDGRVLYRRRNEADKMVVPYMPFLTQLMDCYVNVKITSTVNNFMYLYKYMFKGPDSTRYSISDHNCHVDNLKDFINARHVSASEATWRIFGFEITRKHSSVSCLPVHLPGENFHQMHRRDGNASTATKVLQ
jgi:hypothetical protein